MIVETLDTSRHNRGDFDCGVPHLNEWLAKTAGQAQKRGSAQTFVLTDNDETIIGYYALSSHSVDSGEAPQHLAKGQKRDFPIPAVLIDKLAIALDYQHQKLGQRLLADAVQRILAASASIGIALIVVDALDERAAEYYEQFDFVRWPADSLRLFARSRDVASTFGDDVGPVPCV